MKDPRNAFWTDYVKYLHERHKPKRSWPYILWFILGALSTLAYIVTMQP